MNLRIRSVFVSLLVSLGFVTTASAEPYQFEGRVNGGQIKVEFSNGQEVDIDQFFGGLRYYLRAVDTTSGPLSERAFVDKAAFVGINFSQVKNEFGAKADTITPEVRFVTQSNLIIEATYSQLKPENGDSETDYSVGVGKYLDDRTEAILTYAAPNENLDVLTGSYKKLLNGSTQGTYIGYEASLGYLNSTDDSGYELNLQGTYHLSEVMSVGGGISFTKVGDFDDTGFFGRGQYFISEKLFANIGFLSSSDSFDTSITSLSLGLGGRF